MSARIAANLRRFKEAVNAHDEINPPPHSPAHGIGLSYFDMERLGFDEGEQLWPGIIVQADGGQTANFRVLCDGEHEGKRVAEAITEAVGTMA